MTLTSVLRRRRCCRGSVGLLLLAGGALLATGEGARAQLNPQDLLKQVLPGATQQQGSGDSAAAGERACQRYAEDQGLEVRRIRDTRPSGINNLAVTLSIEDRNDRYDARCIYDTGDRQVRELVPVRGTSSDRARNGGGDDSQDSDVDERLARRAQDACERLAEERDLEDVDFAEARARGRDTVEIDMRARMRGDRQRLTCLYDDEQRHAVLAE